MKTVWSVELEANNWDDDLFNGTFEECVKYCEERDYKVDGEEARLAKLQLNEDGSVAECLEIVDEI